MKDRRTEPGNIISQNLNGCSQYVLKHVLAYLIEAFEPSVLLLQEVHIGEKKAETRFRKLIKETWSCYRVFLSPGKRSYSRGKGDLRLVTLVHASLSPAPLAPPTSVPLLRAQAPGRDVGVHGSWGLQRGKGTYGDTNASKISEMLVHKTC
mmetsp:Transcript_33518/g.75253  ORF Transcript_33518/g.75253 Transcript_33518/m.75253 type:complete len:151 (-) Transcript_33518:1207-1659(-)